MDASAPSSPRHESRAQGPDPEFLPLRTSESYWLVRALLLRGLGLIYVVAFAILVRQNRGLIGEHGILPARRFLDWLGHGLGSRGAGFWELPSVFWLSTSDGWLQAAAWCGLLLALAVLLGFANAPVLGILWALYLSFTHIGQIFYGYGWDMLLCEAGFLAIFLAPLLRPSEFDPGSPPSWPVLLLFRWLVFRVMLGAGLIKLRGDPCWTDLSCLLYHYQTQPNPGPLSPLFHAAPLWFQQLSALFNHLVEVVAPFGVFGPRIVRAISGTLIIAFQVILILSGNLAFLNWLTLILAFACFDDRHILRLVRGRALARLSERLALGREAKPATARQVVSAVLCIAIAVLSLNPVANLLSPRQAMNAAFEPFGIVNTYGAFGSVSRERYEVIIEGTRDAALGPNTEWLEYELPCKPGRVDRRPCWVTPYHYRLDWQLWFVPLAPDQQWRWFLSLTHRLLQEDRQVLALFAENPFPDRAPHFIRASFFHYQFSGLTEQSFWKRERVGQYLAPTSLDDPDFLRILRSYGLDD